MFKEDVAMTIYMLEMVMPPSFFDVMTHLVIHLVKELNLCCHSMDVLHRMDEQSFIRLCLMHEAT
jgi:hypothetical protein